MQKLSGKSLLLQCAKAGFLIISNAVLFYAVTIEILAPTYL